MEMWEKLMSGPGPAFVSGRLEDRLSAFPSEVWAVGDSVPVSDSSEKELSELVGEGTPAGLQALIARIRNMAVKICFDEMKL
jgi:hypothetical protein